MIETQLKARETGVRLTVGTLARFASGMTWREILDITGGHQATWWRNAVAEAETRGLLEWDRAEHVWRLTDEGRELVRGVS